MKTICVALFTLCIFSFASAQYAANFSFNEETPKEAKAETLSLNEKIARRNALIKQHNQLAQRTLLEHIATRVTYPELLREKMVEGRVTVKVTLNPFGQVQAYEILQSPDPAFSREVKRVIDSAPAVVSNQAYLGARKLNIPIDFSLR
ncbi:energy transducer TonB [Phaeodactylibacter xiamenensis]|uniref:energy transducer TonB n=1 Tax=Phaeodactylibacter xiamenensis TaxID=1524460 RepID=UPI003BAD514F